MRDLRRWWIVVLLVAVGLGVGCKKRKRVPEASWRGEIFHGGTEPQGRMRLDKLALCRPVAGAADGARLGANVTWETSMHALRRLPPPPGAPNLGQADLKVLALVVDTADRRRGNPFDWPAFLDGPTGLLERHEALPHRFWRENSYGHVGVDVHVERRVVSMDDQLADYYWPSAETWLRSGPIDASGLPVGPSSERLAFDVLDDTGATQVVSFLLDKPSAAPPDLEWLRKQCDDAFKAAQGSRTTYVTCALDGSGTRLAVNMDVSRVKPGTFVRVHDSTTAPVRTALRLDVPADPDAATDGGVAGAGLAGMTPVVAGMSTLEVRARDGGGAARRAVVTVTAASAGDAAAVETALVAAFGGAEGWLEAFDPGGATDVVGVRLRAAVGGRLWLAGGTALADLGLDGQTRAEGEATGTNSKTLRESSDSLVERVAQRYIDRRVASGDPVPDAHGALGGYDVITVVLPSLNGARAQQTPVWLELRDPQGPALPPIQAGSVIGFDDTDWETWAHEIGHALGTVDLYDTDKLDDEERFPAAQAWPLRWSVMHQQALGNHVDGWHKRELGWIGGTVVPRPPPGADAITRDFRLVPIEWDLGDYSDLGPGPLLTHQLRIDAGPQHSIFVENRQPGREFSQALPSRTTGWSWEGATCPGGGDRGGLLVYDALDAVAQTRSRACGREDFRCSRRPPLAILNPPGTVIPTPAPSPCPDLNQQARAIRPDETRDLGDTDVPLPDKGVSIEGRGALTVPGRPELPPAIEVRVKVTAPPWLDVGIAPNLPPPGAANIPPQIFSDATGIWVDAPGGPDYANYVAPPPGFIALPICSPDATLANTVWVRVVNAGNVDAENVKVQLREVGGGVFDADAQDIGARRFRDFGFSWSPRCGASANLVAVITHYDAEDGVSDSNPGNDYANENYVLPIFAPPGAPPRPAIFGALGVIVGDAHAGPSAPRDTAELVWRIENLDGVERTVWLQPRGLARGVDLEVEHRTVHLPPRSVTPVRARVHLDRAIVPAEPLAKRACDVSFAMVALEVAGDATRTFDSAWVEVNPGPPATLAIDVKVTGTALGISGTLAGDTPGGQAVSVLAYTAAGAIRSADVVTGGDGRFHATIDRLTAGTWTVVAIYGGLDMAPVRAETAITVE